MRGNVRPAQWIAAFAVALAVATGGGPAAGQSAQGMTRAAAAFLDTLDTARRNEAVLPFDSVARLSWSYLPGKRRGLTLARMTPAARAAFDTLLRSALSKPGLAKVETIVSLEDVLRDLEGWAARDPGLYTVTVFGQPIDTGAWGWRYEGHHLSLNWTIVDGKVAGSSPQFMGANPATLRSGPRKDSRALAAEEDMARALMTSLDPAHRARAIVAAEAPADIFTGMARRVAIAEARGIGWADLDSRQRGLLLSLIRQYADAQAPEIARMRLEKIQAGLDRTVFGWMGGTRPGEGHYYRVQGPDFLIEFDNTQNGANHIHCVWREFAGDWGADVLAEHYRTSAHHRRAGELQARR